MDAGSIERAARLLIGARSTGRGIAGFAPDARPKTVEDALAVQDAVTRLGGFSIAAWKVGAPPGARTTYAPVYAGDMYPDGASVALGKYPGMAIEGELAFSLGRDLSASGRPYGIDRIASAVASLCVSVEIGFSRLADFNGAAIAERIADNLGNGGLVVGSGISDWRSVDYKTQPVAMTVNGATQIDRRGGKPGDDPLTLLIWAANNIPGGLKSGAVITTGSWTGQYPAKAGDEIAFAFEGVGSARMNCQ